MLFQPSPARVLSPHDFPAVLAKPAFAKAEPRVGKGAHFGCRHVYALTRDHH